MPGYTGLFTSARSIIVSQTGTLRNIVALLIVGGVEALVTSEKLFVCPRKKYRFYGFTFILVPGIIFTLVSLLIRDKFRKRVQGICREDYKLTKSQLLKIIKVIGESAFIGYMWVFWALLQREYYVCAALGNKKDYKAAELRNVGENSADAKRIQKVIDDAYTEAGDYSQFVGALMVIVIIVVSFIVVLLNYCCSKRPRLPDQNKYEKLEEQATFEAFKKGMKEFALKRGKMKADEFFSKHYGDDLTETFNALGEAYPEGFSEAEDAQVEDAQA